MDSGAEYIGISLSFITPSLSRPKSNLTREPRDKMTVINEDAYECKLPLLMGQSKLMAIQQIWCGWLEYDMITLIFELLSDEDIVWWERKMIHR